MDKPSGNGITISVRFDAETTRLIADEKARIAKVTRGMEVSLAEAAKVMIHRAAETSKGRR